MNRLLVFVALLFCVSTVYAATQTASSASFQSGALNASTVKVFDTSNTTDAINWKPDTIPVSGVTFGAGSNTSSNLWAYGLTYTTGSSGTVTAVVHRKLNATLIGTGSDSTESSNLGDTTGTVSISTYNAPVLATGPGYLAAVTIAFSTTSSISSVNINIWAAGTTTPTAVNIATAAADTSTTTTDYYIGSVWFEDNYFYVLYSQIDGTAAAGGTSVTLWNEGTIYLQAVSTTGSKMYTSPVKVASSLTAALSSAPRGTTNTALQPRAGGSNYTGSTYVNALWKIPTVSGGAQGKIQMQQLNKTSGATIGSAATLLTDVAAGSSAAGFVYTPAGTWFSATTYGVLIQNQTQANSAATTWSYTLLACANVTGSSTSSACTDSGLTFTGAVTTQANNVVQGYGLPYSSTGYQIFATYVTGTATLGITPYSLASRTYYVNGTGISTVSDGSFAGVTSVFADGNYTLWGSYANYDASQTSSAFAYQGYIGKLEYSLFPTTSSSSFSNTLFAFSSFLGVLVASLFVF